MFILILIVMSLTAIIVISIIVAAGIGVGIYFIVKNSSKKPVTPNSKPVALHVIVGAIKNQP